jgi:kumamolisin
MDDPIQTSVWLRSRHPEVFSAAAAVAMAALPLRDRRYLSRDELFAAGHDPQDAARVSLVLERHGLRVVGERWRRLIVEGTEDAHARAFSRDRAGRVHVDPEIASTVSGVYGLGEAPFAVRRKPPGDRSGGLALDRIANHYRFPPGLDGSGESVAVAQFGGRFERSDFTHAMERAGVARADVTCISVAGSERCSTFAHPRESEPFNPEVALDTQVVGALAPGASIALYAVPNTVRGYLELVANAIEDRDRAPTVLSISFGAPESEFPAHALHLMEQLLAAASRIGMTVCCASGDDSARMIYPASSPHVLACGGTTLEDEGRRIVGEVAWRGTAGESGGGFSEHFARPPWQHAHLGHHGGEEHRGVPDVAAHASPGYRVRCGDRDVRCSGTSAAAPLWAALVARLTQRLGKPLGLIAPMLYTHASLRTALRDITAGGNGRYDATRGWDPCTGLGVPLGTSLLSAFAELA